MKNDAEGTETERGSPITLRSIVYGSLVGVLYIFLAVYVSLKTGVVFIGGMTILGYILLSIRGRYNIKENVVLSSIVDGTVCVSAGVVAGLPALVIFAGRTLYYTPITLELIFTISIFAGVLGIFLLLPFKEEFLKMPWPQVVPLYKTIEGLGAEASAKNRLLKWMGISAAYIGGVLSISYTLRSDLTIIPPMETLPNWWTRLVDFAKTWNPPLYNNLSQIQTAYQFIGQAMAPSPLPGFMGVSNSPLIASIGYFVGWKRAAMIFLGGVYSLLVWVFFENQFLQPGRFVDYGSHINLPQIFYLAMGVLVAFLAWSFIKGALEWLDNRKKMGNLQAQLKAQSGDHETRQLGEGEGFSSAPVMSLSEQIRAQLSQARPLIKDWLRLAVTKYKTVLAVLAVFLVGSLLLFYVFQPFYNIRINPLFMLLSAPALLISSWWSAITLSETGFLTGFLTDLLAVPAILAFDINFPSLIVFFTLMTVMQASALRVIGWLKVGRELKVKDRTVLISVLYGVLFGAIVGSLIVFLLYETYGFGTSYFPAPTAAITGIFFLSILQFKELVFPSSTMFATQSLTAVQHFQQLYQYIFQPYVQYYPAVFMIIGLIVGLVLSKLDLSPTSFLVGVLIPPAYSFSIMLGGGLNYYVYRKNKENTEEYLEEDSRYQQALSGVSAGEGLVYLVWIMVTTMLMMLGI
ncbi:MAG: OPT/YSL family transporter [Candidatus Freyrarchaeum guaymaensis]